MTPNQLKFSLTLIGHYLSLSLSPLIAGCCESTEFSSTELPVRVLDCLSGNRVSGNVLQVMRRKYCTRWYTPVTVKPLFRIRPVWPGVPMWTIPSDETDAGIYITEVWTTSQSDSEYKRLCTDKMKSFRPQTLETRISAYSGFLWNMDNLLAD
jgi:hypothetical protein